MTSNPTPIKPQPRRPGARAIRRGGSISPEAQAAMDEILFAAPAQPINSRAPHRSQSTTGDTAPELAAVDSAVMRRSRDPERTLRHDQPTAPQRGLDEPAPTESLEARIRKALAASGHAGVAGVTVNVRDGRVTLTGTVPSLAERLVAVNVVRPLSGVTQVIDQLKLVTVKPTKPALDLSAWWPSGPIELSAEGLQRRVLLSVAATLILLSGWGVYAYMPVGNLFGGGMRPVSGRVLFEGQPLEGAKIVLHPIGAQSAGAPPSPSGVTNAEGDFTLTTFQPGDGAPAGSFIATVEWTPGKPTAGASRKSNPVAAAKLYGQPESSPLLIAITPETATLPTFELSGSPSLE